jgi:hypothetical protein
MAKAEVIVTGEHRSRGDALHGFAKLGVVDEASISVLEVPGFTCGGVFYKMDADIYTADVTPWE